MAKIHDYKTYHGLEDLKRIVDEQDPTKSEDLMHALHPFRDKEIGGLLQRIIDRFIKFSKYTTPMEWFTPKKFNTFMEYFKRKITEDKAKDIESKLADFSLTLPTESNVESLGDFSDTSSILRLKKPTKDVVKDLTTYGMSNVLNMSFISLKLLKSYYHRVHCPVDGKIQKITFVGRDEPFFGDNSLWIVEFDSKYGRVYLLVVGEKSIQDFDFRLKIGDEVKKFDELGNFDWGSQTVLIFESEYFRGECLIQKGERYFVGEGIFADINIISPSDELENGREGPNPNRTIFTFHRKV